MTQSDHPPDVLPVLPDLDAVAQLLFPLPQFDDDEESLHQQGLSDEHIEAMMDARDEAISEIYRERESWIHEISVRADVLEPDDAGYPDSAIQEALKASSSLVEHHNNVLDRLVALAVKHTRLSSRTVESTISMGHNAVRRRAENGDTSEVRALIAKLLRDEAERYTAAADQMENES